MSWIVCADLIILGVILGIILERALGEWYIKKEKKSGIKKEKC